MTTMEVSRVSEKKAGNHNRFARRVIEEKARNFVGISRMHSAGYLQGRRGSVLP